MAILCSQCGETIEKDEAQFCTHCGAPVQRQSSTSQSSKHADQSMKSANQPAPSAAQEDKSVREQPARQGNQHPPLREQIAEQPGAKKQSPASVRVQIIEQAGKEFPGEERPVLKEQIAQIHPSSRPSTPPLAEQEESQEKEQPIEERPTQRMEFSSRTEQEESQEKEQPIEEIPTQRMEFSSLAEQKASQEEKQPVEERPKQIIANKASRESLEEIPTTPLVLNTQSSGQGGVALRAEAASILGQQHPPVAPAARQEEARRPGSISSSSSSNMATSAASALSSRQAEKRVPRRLIAAVVVALVLIGVGIWIVAAQPFSIPAVTQPQVGFTNDALHVSLLYPNGWLYTVSPSQSTVQFHDSSNTAQMSIVTANASGDDLSTYLQSQADHAGIATPKALSPVSFAGATWQGVQGTVQQKGANYTCTIFATVQGNRLVTIIQQAPQNTYNAEDNVVFAQMRASLKLS